MIATPMYGGNAKSGYVLSLQNLVVKLATEGYQVETSIIGNESLITRARNTLVHRFLETDADILLFIDSDHAFDSADVFKMIESDKDIIGAISPMKGVNWSAVRLASIAVKEDLAQYAGIFNINVSKEVEEIDVNEPIEVDEVGTGIMCIKREVFEKIAPLCNKYISDSLVSSGDSIKDQEIIEYFRTEIDSESRRLLSEDYAFCNMWRKLGNTVWAAPWVKMTHICDHSFTGNLSSSLELVEIQRQYLEQSKEASSEQDNS